MNRSNPQQGSTTPPGDRADVERTRRGRRGAIEMIVAYGTCVTALGLSAGIGRLFDSAILAGTAFLLVVAAGFFIVSRLSPSTTSPVDCDPRPATSVPAVPPMHDLIKVPIFAEVLLGLWVITWACTSRYGIGFGLFLVLAATVAKVVAVSLPLAYGVLVVLLFWSSAVVLLMWPGGGFPSDMPWPIMVGGPVLHLCGQIAIYAGGTAPPGESKKEPPGSAPPEGPGAVGSSSGRAGAAGRISGEPPSTGSSSGRGDAAG